MPGNPPECPECYREMRLQSVKELEQIWHCSACNYHLVDRTVGPMRRMTPRTGPDAEPMFASIQGHCPHGCGATLEVNIVTGQLSCSNGECPNPNAVQAILDHNEPNHIVRIEEEGWVIKHPLLERVEDRLFDCEVGRTLAMLPPPRNHWRPGDYEVTINDDGSWNWKKLGDD